jgi:hypothetical protein
MKERVASVLCYSVDPLKLEVYLKIQFLHHRKQALSPVQSLTGFVPVDSSPEEKAMVCEADRSSPSNAEVKNGWSYIITSPYVYLHGKSIKRMDMFAFIVVPCNFPWAWQKAAP